VVGNDKAGDNGLTEAPARFDQAFISASDRVFGEHDPSDIGIEERLDDSAHAGPGEQANTLAVGDGRVGVRRAGNALGSYVVHDAPQVSRAVVSISLHGGHGLLIADLLPSERPCAKFQPTGLSGGQGYFAKLAYSRRN
jgi:hypothetical protein